MTKCLRIVDIVEPQLAQPVTKLPYCQAHNLCCTRLIAALRRERLLQFCGRVGLRRLVGAYQR